MGNKQSSRQGAKPPQQKPSKMGKNSKTGKSECNSAKKKKLDYSVVPAKSAMAEVREGVLQEDRSRGPWKSECRLASRRRSHTHR